ncbi:MAG: haloacid dehalogenase-like hydrolase [Patescibacteria group bacterium]
MALKIRVIQVIDDLLTAGKIQRDLEGKVPAVISDVDGTVGKWQLLISLLFMIADVFHEKRHIIQQLKDAVMDYNAYNGSFESVMMTALQILPKATEGLGMDMVKHLSAVVALRDLSMVYAFPKALLECHASRPMKDRCLIVAITGTPQFLADPFCKALHFDIPIGCEYKVDGRDRLTGERDEATAIHKEEPLEVLRECGVRPVLSLVDSKTDLPLVLAVPLGNALGINPKPSLMEYIRNNSERRITAVSDHRSTGVQFYRADAQGRLYEVTRWEALPAGLAYALPPLRGELVLPG